jgi:hypothetical protein
MDEEAEEKHRQRVVALCSLIETLADGYTTGEYLSALHICAGRRIWQMPNEMKEGVLQKFFLEVRNAARKKL